MSACIRCTRCACLTRDSRGGRGDLWVSRSSSWGASLGCAQRQSTPVTQAFPPTAYLRHPSPRCCQVDIGSRPGVTFSFTAWYKKTVQPGDLVLLSQPSTSTLTVPAGPPPPPVITSVAFLANDGRCGACEASTVLAAGNGQRCLWRMVPMSCSGAPRRRDPCRLRAHPLTSPCSPPPPLLQHLHQRNCHGAAAHHPRSACVCHPHRGRHAGGAHAAGP